VFDSNQDGVLDAADTRFGEFRIWQDLDQDGETDAGELKTLAAAGIASIGLERTEIANDEEDGTRVTATAIYTRTDSLTGLVGDAVLEAGAFGFRRETVNGVTTVTLRSGAGIQEIADTNGVSLDIGAAELLGAVGARSAATPRRRPCRPIYAATGAPWQRTQMRRPDARSSHQENYLIWRPTRSPEICRDFGR
jgi:hypothetical protein